MPVVFTLPAFLCPFFSLQTYLGNCVHTNICLLTFLISWQMQVTANRIEIEHALLDDIDLPDTSSSTVQVRRGMQQEENRS